MSSYFDMMACFKLGSYFPNIDSNSSVLCYIHHSELTHTVCNKEAVFAVFLIIQKVFQYSFAYFKAWLHDENN